MSSRGEADQPPARHYQKKAKPEPKHWLEYAIFIFVIGTALATGAAAYYTRQQWLTAVDQEKRSLRAYVSFDAATPFHFDSEKMAFTLENFGETPAKDIAVFSNWEFLPFGEQLSKNFEFSEKAGCSWPQGQKRMQPSISIILPKNSVSASHYHCPEEVAGLVRAEKKEANAWLYGHIDYSDIFNERHQTTFCLLYWPFEQKSIFCDRHNEMDPEK
jgi:hypothetical protein